MHSDAFKKASLQFYYNFDLKQLLKLRYWRKVNSKSKKWFVYVCCYAFPSDESLFMLLSLMSLYNKMIIAVR